MEVKEKKVELIELFYDLIYVYAISRMTMLVEEPTDGVLSPQQFLRYLIASLLVLQAWLYMTNYVNRYGSWTWYEYGISCVNMMAAVYMANTISPDWNSMSASFNYAMLVMFLSIAVLYAIQTRGAEAGAAKNSLTILGIVCGIYALSCVFHALRWNEWVIFLDTAAILTGAFLPFLLRGNFQSGIISFPHLAERFELLTIITFGESVVGMTEYFDVYHFNFRAVLVFFVILTLFGSYVVQIHYLMEHHRVERSLRLMFSHYGVVISINLVTVTLKLLEQEETNRLFATVVMFFALLLFYASILWDSAYYKKTYRLEMRDVIQTAVGLAAGSVVTAVLRENTSGFLLGTALSTGYGLILLLRKYHEKEETLP